jgi:hypothetical protein
MVEKLITAGQNVVVDFARYQAGRDAASRLLSVKPLSMSARACRHCGAALLDGENEDDCSSVLAAGFGAAIEAPRMRSIPRMVCVD